MGRMCTLIGELKANISDLNFVVRKPDYYKLRIDIEVRDSRQFHSILTALEAQEDVAVVRRHRDTGQNTGQSAPAAENSPSL